MVILLLAAGRITVTGRDRVVVPGQSLGSEEHPANCRPLGWILASALAAAVAAGPAEAMLRPGAGLGAAAGLLYAAGDVSTKAAINGTSPVLVFALLIPACHGLAFVCLQLAFQRGTALATAGLSTLLTNLLPILAGLTVFAEQMPGGLPGALRGLGFAEAVLKESGFGPIQMIVLASFPLRAAVL